MNAEPGPNTNPPFFRYSANPIAARANALWQTRKNWQQAYEVLIGLAAANAGLTLLVSACTSIIGKFSVGGAFMMLSPSIVPLGIAYWCYLNCAKAEIISAAANREWDAEQQRLKEAVAAWKKTILDQDLAIKDSFRQKRARMKEDWSERAGRLLEFLVTHEPQIQPNAKLAKIERDVLAWLPGRFQFPMTDKYRKVLRDKYIPFDQRKTWHGERYPQLIIIAFICGATIENLPPKHTRWKEVYEAIAVEQQIVILEESLCWFKKSALHAPAPRNTRGIPSTYDSMTMESLEEFASKDIPYAAAVATHEATMKFLEEIQSDLDSLREKQSRGRPEILICDMPENVTEEEQEADLTLEQEIEAIREEGKQRNLPPEMIEAEIEHCRQVRADRQRKAR